MSQSAATPSPDEQVLVDLLTAALDQLERGQTVDAAALCHARPDLVGPLRNALCVASRLDSALVPTDPRVGRTVGGRYRILRPLGQGASARVYEALDQSLRRRVALKVLDRAWIAGPDQAERFKREAVAVAALRHEHVVALYDQGVDPADGTPFLVMERIAGIDLATLLAAAARHAGDGAPWTGRLLADGFPPDLPADGPFWDQAYAVVATHLARGIASALGAAHAAGVIHRDVKPSNVLVEPAGRAVLVDFGLARLPAATTLTQADRVLGTPWYMAPEQAAGNARAVDKAADVYGLGATLYHLLALQPPFQDDFVSILQRVRRDEPPRLRSLRPELPRDLATVCGKAMEKRPADRYPTMGALVADLDALLELRPIRAVPPGPLGRGVRFVRRRPERAAVLALALLLVPAAPLALRAITVHAAQKRETATEAARAHVPPTATLLGRDPDAYLGPRRPDTESVKALDRVLAIQPDDDEALLLRSMAHLDEQRHAQGLDDLRRLSRSRPQSRVLPALVAALPSMLAADDWIERLPAELPPAEEPIDQYVLGYLWLRARGMPQAVPTAVALLRQAAGRMGLVSGPAHLLLIALLLDLRPEEVLAEAARQEVARGTEGARSRYVMAAAQYQLGRFAAAAEGFREVVTRWCPGHDRSWHNLGLARKRLGAIQEAATCLERAATLEPAAIKTIEELGKIYRELGDWPRAEALLSLLPMDGPMAFRRDHVEGRLRAAQAEAASNAGAREDAASRWAQAGAAFERALAAAPAELRPRVACDVAMVRFQRGEADAALELVLDGLDGMERDAYVLRWAARIAREQGVPLPLVRHLLRAAHREDPRDRLVAQDLISALLEAKPPDVIRASQVLCTAVDGAWSTAALRLMEEILNAAGSDPRAFVSCFDRVREAGAFAQRPPADALCRRLARVAAQAEIPIPESLVPFLLSDRK